MDDIETLMKNCRLCPRNCGADRSSGKKGYCGAGAEILVARAALHMWEEPCISGSEGSGAVFFSGCSLGCVFCQNRSISRGERGEKISAERLAQIMLELQDQKANNINLVTAGHFVPQIAAALALAKEQGLRIPVVYNSSGYEKAETLGMLSGWWTSICRISNIWILSWPRRIPERRIMWRRRKRLLGKWSPRRVSLCLMREE